MIMTIITNTKIFIIITINITIIVFATIFMINEFNPGPNPPWIIIGFLE